MKKFFLIAFLPFFAFAAACQQKQASGISVNLRIVTQLPTVLIESSGIVAENENSIWSHNDAGNTNKIYTFDTTGALIRTIKIDNVQNIDWEDMARDAQGRYYLEDAGNNDNNRTDLAIYRIPNPTSITGNTVNAEIINFTLEDQTLFPPGNGNMNYDIEAMAWKSDTLFLFTKNRSTPGSGFSKMYKLPATPGTYTAKLCDSIYTGNSGSENRVTSADIHPVTGELILLTPSKLISFKNYPANNFFEGQITNYFFTTQPGQIESVAFVSPYRLYLTEEGKASKPGNLYALKLPDETIGLDENNTLTSLFNIFPNPVSNILTITQNQAIDYSYAIYNAAGCEILHGESNNRCEINMTSLAKGIYFLFINNEQYSMKRKIIKL